MSRALPSRGVEEHERAVKVVSREPERVVGADVMVFEAGEGLVIEGDEAFDGGVSVEPRAELVDAVGGGEDGRRFAEWVAEARASELALDLGQRRVLTPARRKDEDRTGACDELVEEPHAAHVEGAGVPGGEHAVDVQEEDSHSKLRRGPKKNHRPSH